MPTPSATVPLTANPPAGSLRALHLSTGGTLAYRLHPGCGTAFFLVHGAGSSMASWEPTLRHLLLQGRPVLTVDLPGHGESSIAAGSYHPQTSIEALAELVEHERLGSVHLVGHSLGGALVVGLAESLGPRAQSVTLVSAGGLGKQASLPLRAATLPAAGPALALAFSRPTLAALDRLGSLLSSLGIPHVFGPSELGSIAWLATADRRRAFLATLRQVVGPWGQRMSTLPSLARLDGSRFLLIWGSEDPVLPVRHVFNAHSVLPGSSLHVFSGAGHEPHSAQPERFVRLLLEHASLVESS